MMLEHLCAEVVKVVKHAGSFIKQQRLTFPREAVQRKGVRDLVSYVDVEAERLLVDELRQLMPQAGFLTEEQTTHSKATDLCWVIDPLDGTTNFVHGLPVFSVSVALLHGTQLLVGVVHEVNRDETFYAWRGGGAWSNGSRIQVSGCQHLRDALIATGFPYRNFDEAPQFFDALKFFFNNTHGVRRLGSAAADLVYVACGRFDAFFEYHLNPWDVAAGALIVQEAGGVISDFRGGQNFLWGRQILAATPAIYADMLRVITQPL
ncbi:MAG: inositol monophosphatase [Chitinophagales bacterium]|nr:inositol monophosphatase [Chitinophagales bacterium]MDW8427364.1 inositol monophosphatase family protein [Chitinophagales bacterium]